MQSSHLSGLFYSLKQHGWPTFLVMYYQTKYLYSTFVTKKLETPQSMSQYWGTTSSIYRQSSSTSFIIGRKEGHKKTNEPSTIVFLKEALGINHFSTFFLQPPMTSFMHFFMGRSDFYISLSGSFIPTCIYGFPPFDLNFYIFSWGYP